MKNGVRSVAAVLLLACAVGTHCFGQEGNYSTAAIEKLNLQFRRIYAETRGQRLQAAGPVVLARGDDLVLLHRGQRYQGSVVSAEYHDLKTVAHIPLAVYCVLAGAPETPLSEPQLAQLRLLCPSIRDVLHQVDEVFESVRVQKDQTSLLTRSLEICEASLADGQRPADGLEAFLDDIRPAMLRNVRRATKLRLENYHRQMLLWQELLNEDDRRQLHVVIPGAPMPRQNSAAVQYFTRLLREPDEGSRVIYAESQFDESQDLALLGTHLLDREVGTAFFGDPWRMQRDLLGTAASAWLDRIDFDDFHDDSAD